MQDQNKLWNDLHNKNALTSHSQSPTEFAQNILNLIPPNSRILELGCGVGNDSSYFAINGHIVIATDFSEVAIKKNRENYKPIKNLSFEVIDIGSVPLPYQSGKFNLVYARLSLHYFTNEITQKIINEVYRVLKPHGFFCFMCKSINNSKYGKGIEIEKDMYEDEGHVRHFFSEIYTREILVNRFEIVSLNSKEEKLYGKHSAYIEVIAKK